MSAAMLVRRGNAMVNQGDDAVFIAEGVRERTFIDFENTR
jgi:hypothetical protein